MTYAEAKSLAKIKFGPMGFATSYRGGMAGYYPRPMVYRVGRYVPGKTVQYLGHGNTWEEAFSEARKESEQFNE